MNPKIIVALDFASMVDALQFAGKLDPSQCRLKVGKELFTTCGPEIVRKLQSLGFEIFLDLKFHDIPNTVAGACAAAADLGVWMVNVHAAGGQRMLQAAREAIPVSASPTTRLIAVTVLTSLTAEDMQETGISRVLEEQVDALAMLTKEAGLDGVVCSPHESRRLRALCGDHFSLVTPGVRPQGSAKADQRRVMTPSEAVQAGSDYLVIGRAITQAAEPLLALKQIVTELDVAATV